MEAGAIAVATQTEIDTLCVNTIRTLSIDAIQKANSGHPGTPMAMAPVAYTLWQRFLRFDPEEPIWPNRDRFVLSAGHASMLLYALLHLTRVRAVDPDYETLGEPSVSLDDIKSFRQLDSRCPGHPEYRWTSGVETTTGPLGQGAATSIGMAIASKWLAAHFNRPDFELFGYDIYVICGDGDFEEGVSSEAASLAGHQQLDNLCWIYDNNHISIDGRTEITYQDDVAARFMGYGWNVERVGDANDRELLATAFERFRAEVERPTLIIVDSHIGYGSPHKQDTPEAHGEPLGEEEVRETKRAYGWPEDAQFLVPDGVYEHFAAGIGARGHELSTAWDELFAAYRRAEPELAAEIDAMQRRELPDGWDAEIPGFDDADSPMATRKASNKVENAIAERVPWMLAGSADLTDSTSVRLSFDGAVDFQPGSRRGRQLHYGIREHESAATSNGLSLSKLRAAVVDLPHLLRLRAARDPALRADGAARDPRLHPRLDRARGGRADPPAGRAARLAARDPGPQRDPALRRERGRRGLARDDGAAPPARRARADPPGRPDPRPLALRLGGGPAPRRLRARRPARRRARADPDRDRERGRARGRGPRGAELGDGVRARVVSLPSCYLFDQQPEDYRESVLPPAITARVSIEQASTLGWDRYVGPRGAMIGMHTFGSSAPLKDVLDKFGFTPEKVAETAREVLERAGGERHS